MDVTPCFKFLAMSMYELDVLPALIKDIKKKNVSNGLDNLKLVLDYHHQKPEW